jgi:hypothetical protein
MVHMRRKQKEVKKKNLVANGCGTLLYPYQKTANTTTLISAVPPAINPNSNSKSYIEQ